ncbi:VOC family protein [Rhizorhabdus wittichii]|uniref:VOC family protein n=1 Tax=Rhizorhabdus wittichii TaxID=160791 RepID=UPI0002E64C21|nr:VOC family protein [Rhizorhabdus wittichii]
MSEISSLGYVGYSVSDLDRWEELAVDILGFVPGRRDPGRSLGLRMDKLEQRIVLERDGKDDLKYVGWLFDTEDDLDGFVDKARDAGVDIRPQSAEIAKQRAVDRVHAVADPNGVIHEFAFGPKFASAHEPFQSKVLRGGFVTGRLGVGHVLEVARDYGETVAFARRVLGLKVSDYIRGPQPMPNGIFDVEAAFFHTRTGRHHSLATAEVPTPLRIHHMMVEVSDMDDVGLAYDRCRAAGFPIGMELGHHPNDGMFSFYVRTPSGFLIEFGWGGVVIDDADWEVKTYSQLSDWGHAHAH